MSLADSNALCLLEQDLNITLDFIALKRNIAQGSSEQGMNLEEARSKLPARL
ncbi:MAG: hypothetical protein FWD76_03340 [Firmicutes bacterium]|nr:hypothetical protein [Bacillota bacterium]